eukprot:gnl/TRDRNA2_/TRDRNA2_147848_c0_seq1.p1 gnl/TRDRNA2_/TRDRNA2_147848_c0~~gnl/TRDRNA2_/TRDRNA2_147848_c0_seq1.p1  ORF type:complete len:324 (+),score=42.08 gnl/TRDRNA2_/TRDRNA2_147848_c0_seq1:87-1058(+)
MRACLLLTCAALSDCLYTSNGPLRVQSPTIVSRPAQSRVVTARSSGRNSRKADVYISADRSLEYSIPGKVDQLDTASLTSYMQLPAYLYVQKLFPSKLERVEKNKFRLAVPPLKFFEWEVNPVTYSYIRQSDSAVIIESNESTLKGSPLIEALNGRFFFQIRTELTWRDQSVAKAIKARSQVEMWVNPPPPFNLIPAPLQEAGANTVFQLVLDALHQEFLKSLGDDVEKFQASKKYREEWASAVEADKIASEGSSSPLLLAQVSGSSPRSTTGPVGGIVSSSGPSFVAAMGFAAATAVIAIVGLSGRRRRGAVASCEETLLAS